MTEAEDTLRAIGAGEIDAFVVSNGQNDGRVFALETADRPYRMFVENMRDGAATLSSRGLILYANARLAELLSCSKESIVGSPLAMFMAGGRAIDSQELGGPGGQGATLEFDLIGGDGMAVPVRVGSSPLVVDGDRLTCLTFTDLRAQKAQEHEIARLTQVQAEREQLEQLRLSEARRKEKEGLEAQLNQLRRLESVGQLAGGIAHDFNNLLVVIINYAQFVAEATPADSPTLEDVAEIRRAAERAAALTKQLLIFSRREVVRPQVLDLNDVVSEMDRLLRRALGEHIELQRRFAPGLWPVEADPGQLEQVLVNLAVNARDAMPGGGRLLLETANVELDGDTLDIEPPVKPGRYVRLAVSDTGVGMTREIVGRVYEPFFSTKPRGEGTGLGLTTVYGIGTTVKVHLPAADGTPARKRTTPARAQPGRGETVLIVEDEPSIRILTERILHHAGYRIVVATCGSEALEICESQEQPIDLLLSDVMMPEMQGPEVAARAKVIRPGLKVLLMSGYVAHMRSEPDPNRTDPLVDLIEKPFTAETLLTRVRGALDTAATRTSHP